MNIEIKPMHRAATTVWVLWTDGFIDCIAPERWVVEARAEALRLGWTNANGQSA